MWLLTALSTSVTSVIQAWSSSTLVIVPTSVAPSVTTGMPTFRPSERPLLIATRRRPVARVASRSPRRATKCLVGQRSRVVPSRRSSSLESRRVFVQSGDLGRQTLVLGPQRLVLARQVARVAVAWRRCRRRAGRWCAAATRPARAGCRRRPQRDAAARYRRTPAGG